MVLKIFFSGMFEYSYKKGTIHRNGLLSVIILLFIFKGIECTNQQCAQAETICEFKNIKYTNTTPDCYPRHTGKNTLISSVISFKGSGKLSNFNF